MTPVEIDDTGVSGSEKEISGRGLPGHDSNLEEKPGRTRGSLMPTSPTMRDSSIPSTRGINSSVRYRITGIGENVCLESLSSSIQSSDPSFWRY